MKISKKDMEIILISSIQNSAFNSQILVKIAQENI